MNSKWFAAVVTVSLAGAGFSIPPSAKQGLLMAMQANAKKMAPQWKQKITVFRGGMPMQPIIQEVRLDAEGQMHRIVLSQPEEKRMGPLRARKVAEVKEDIQEVMQLAGRYANPRQIGDAIQRGELWEGQGRLRLQARSVVLPNDDVTIIFNSTTYLASRIDVRSQHEGSPVTIAIDYEQLPNGPSMMSRMTVQIPKDSIVINVESFDFARPAGQMTY